jgi:hypothetical protein
MKVRLLEGMWRHKVPKSLVLSFETAIENYIDNVADGSDIDTQYMFRSYQDINRRNMLISYEPIKIAAIDILEHCKKFYGAEEDDYIIEEINDLISSVESITNENSGEDVNDVLNAFYDFMDEHSIFLNTNIEDNILPGSYDSNEGPMGEGAKMVTLNPEGDELDEARLVYDDEKDHSEDILKVSSLLADWVGSLGQPELKKLTQYKSSMERVEVTPVKKAIEDFIAKSTSGSIVVSDKVTHAHDIGNNNAFEIHRVTPAEKEHIGFLYIVDNMYGSCLVSVRDNKDKLVGDRYQLSPTFIGKNDKPFKNFMKSDKGI